jgi:hypothetical protein
MAIPVIVVHQGCSQGREYVLMRVMPFIASITPSLSPRPESLTPPNGDHSSL